MLRWNERTLLLTALCSWACAHSTRRTDDVRRDPTGCYRAEPALTYSATGAPEQGDTSWAYVRLMSDGKAARPLRPARDDLRSSWQADGDTLRVLCFDGLAGWKLLLTADLAGWSGTAEYLSDAIAIGEEPYRHAITLRACACPESA